MELSELKELLAYLNKNKESVLPALTEAISLVEYVGVKLEPIFKKITITKSVEYTTEKFKLLCDNGFTRQEALSIILNDRDVLKELLTQKSKAKKS